MGFRDHKDRPKALLRVEMRGGLLDRKSSFLEVEESIASITGKKFEPRYLLQKAGGGGKRVINTKKRSQKDELVVSCEKPDSWSPFIKEKRRTLVDPYLVNVLRGKQSNIAGTKLTANHCNKQKSLGKQIRRRYQRSERTGETNKPGDRYNCIRVNIIGNRRRMQE